jgi:aerobic carbon-monoxide dehydrogenase medium subunit
MVAAEFDYVTADSYDDAVRLVAGAGDEAKVLAGGQSLMPMLNLRLAKPTVLIDINRVDDRPPTAADGWLILPALTRHRMLIEHDLVRRHCPLLAEATTHVGNVRVRNRGTVGGSLAHADATAELGCCALATGARVVARGPDGDRTLPASELFAGYWSTTLDESELITDLLIPVARPRQGWSFREMVQRTSDFAVVAVAVILSLSEGDETIAAARIALAGVADRPIVADAGLTAELTSAPADPAGAGVAADRVAAGIADALAPPSDVHATGDYRRRLARVLIRRAIGEAYARATGARS